MFARFPREQGKIEGHEITNQVPGGTGAGEGIRTLDFDLGKVALYP